MNPLQLCRVHDRYVIIEATVYHVKWVSVNVVLHALHSRVGGQSMATTNSGDEAATELSSLECFRGQIQAHEC